MIMGTVIGLRTWGEQDRWSGGNFISFALSALESAPLEAESVVLTLRVVIIYS